MAYEKCSRVRRMSFRFQQICTKDIPRFRKCKRPSWKWRRFRRCRKPLSSEVPTFIQLEWPGGRKDGSSHWEVEGGNTKDEGAPCCLVNCNELFSMSMWPSSHGCQAKVISQEDFGNFLEKSKTHLVFVKNLPEDGESSLDGFFFPSACCYSESGHWRWRWHQTHGEKHQKSHETWQMSWYPLVPSLIVDSLELWCWGSVLIPLMAGTGRGVGRLLRLPEHVVCRGLQWLKRPITKQLVPVWYLGQWHSWSKSCSIEIWLCNMQCEERVLSYDSKAFQVRVPFNRMSWFDKSTCRWLRKSSTYHIVVV